MKATWRYCDSKVCGVKTAHTKGYDADWKLVWHCGNCHRETVTKTKAKTKGGKFTE